METFNPIITVTLKQHSPMLHFQYLEKDLKPPVNASDFPPGHAGACLRPSEVKPKLDKFLLRWFRENNKENGDIEKMYQALLVGDGTHPALDYKMSIFAPKGEKPTLPDMRDLSIYYGNMGAKFGEAIHAVLWEGSITMKLVCFNPAVKELLTPENLAKFFICTNFGRMTSKGFGSFTVQTVNAKPVRLDRTYGEILAINYDNYGAPVYYTLESSCNGRTETNSFKVIKDFYTKMKSGLSQEKVQSYLFQYFQLSQNGKGGNEKAAIRKFLNNRETLNPKQYRYVRCLLGMGDRISVKQPFKDTISIRHKTIARFGSPLLFKIIDGKIYLVATPINPAIFGQSFCFRLKSDRNSCFYLSTPKEFNMDKFLQYCCEKDGRLKRKEVSK